MKKAIYTLVLLITGLVLDKILELDKRNGFKTN
jgi:hypothetical protein